MFNNPPPAVQYRSTTPPFFPNPNQRVSPRLAPVSVPPNWRLPRHSPRILCRRTTSRPPHTRYRCSLLVHHCLFARQLMAWSLSSTSEVELETSALVNNNRFLRTLRSTTTRWRMSGQCRTTWSSRRPVWRLERACSSPEIRTRPWMPLRRLWLTESLGMDLNRYFDTGSLRPCCKKAALVDACYWCCYCQKAFCTRRFLVSLLSLA